MQRSVRVSDVSLARSATAVPTEIRIDAGAAPRPDYDVFVKSGVRFSWNAVMPSLAAAVQALRPHAR